MAVRAPCCLPRCLLQGLKFPMVSSLRSFPSLSAPFDSDDRSVKPFLPPLLGFHTLRPPSPLTAAASQSPSLIPSLFPSSKQSYILSYHPTDESSPKSPKGRQITLRKMPRATVLTIKSNLEAT